MAPSAGGDQVQHDPALPRAPRSRVTDPTTSPGHSPVTGKGTSVASADTQDGSEMVDS